MDNNNSFLKRINFKLILPILLSIAVLLTGIAVLFYYNPFDSVPVDNNSVISNDNTSSVATTPPVYNKSAPNIKATATIKPGVDFSLKPSDFDKTTAEIKALIEKIATDRFDSVNVILNTGDDLIISDTDDRLSYIHSFAKNYGLSVITTIDLTSYLPQKYDNEKDLENIVSILASKQLLDNTDMIVLDGYFITDDTDKMTEAMSSIYYSVAKAAPELCLGVKCDYLYTKNDEEADAEYMLDDKHSDIKLWAEKDIIDFVMISNSYPTSVKNINFEYFLNSWENALNDKTNLYCILSYSKLGLKETGWQKTDEIIKQIMCLDDTEYKGFIFDSYKSFADGDKESRNTILKFLSGQINDKYIVTDLSLSSPSKTSVTTYTNTIAFIGASDPSFSMTFNGKPVERNNLGYFSFDVELEFGLNTFVIEHKGVKTTYKVTYKKTVIKSYTPTNKLSLEGGSTINVTTVSPKNSTVNATFNGSTITLSEHPIIDGNGFEDAEYSNYTGSFTLPIVYDNNISLGKIKIDVKSSYGNQSVQSENITVIKTKSDLIAEVIIYQAETFNPEDYSDKSRPTNSYLPKGTVDYCSVGTTVSGSEVMRTLGYGKMVYTRHKNVDNIKVYNGVLPDHNELTVAGFDGDGKHSKLTLDVLWKAPFTLELKEQAYVNTSAANRDYSLKNNTATFSYVDITFSYATVLNGDLIIPEDNKLFSRAEWIKNDKNYTLRLYLKKVGGFYGWTAEYNSNGQLEFYFLNPAIITAADNKYGYSLDGIKVFLNVGHGGGDPGALGSNSQYTEAVLNLTLAQKVKAELESIGATVIMDRTDNTTPITDEGRMEMIHATKPDYVLAIHRNSSSASSPRGFTSYHFNPYSYKPAKLLYDKMAESGLYKNSIWSGTKWHLYFVSRVSTCPIVLTENGFMSNTEEYSDMIKDDFNDKCAVELTKGIIEHFKSIQ